MNRSFILMLVRAEHMEIVVNELVDVVAGDFASSFLIDSIFSV